MSIILHMLAADNLTLAQQVMVMQAGKTAEAELVKRYDFYWAVASSVATFLLIGATFLGFGAWRNVKAGLKSEVVNDVRSELLASEVFKKELVEAARVGVAADFERKSARLERQIQLSKLQYLSNKVQSASAFSNSERDALYNQLIVLRDDPDIVHDVNYKTSLEQVLDSFYGAGLWSRMDDLEGNLSEVIKEVPGIVQTMVFGYSLRVLGGIDADEKVIASFLRYLDIIEDHKLWSISLPVRLAYRFSVGTTRAEIDRFKEDVADLSEKDVMLLLNTVDHLADPYRVAKNPKNTHRRGSAFYQQVKDVLTEMGYLDKLTDQDEPVADHAMQPFYGSQGPAESTAAQAES